MNNTQLYLSIGLPMLVFILTWLANRAEMNRHIDRIDRTIESMRTDIRGELSRETSTIRADMSAIRAELIAIRNDHHKDLISLMGYMVPLHERMAKIESQHP